MGDVPWLYHIVSLLKGNRLHLLLVFIPITFALEALHAPPLAVFLTAAVAIIPLAALIGESTESLSHRAGPGIGGLLNATFGNAAEAILAFIALRAGLLEVVKASITGSILGNLLLVLGLSMLLGGLGRERQTFNRTAAGASAAMLVLALAALVLPAIFDLAVFGRLGPTPPEVLWFSLLVSIVLLGVYTGSLVFSLRTHRELFAPVGEEAHPPTALPSGVAVGVLMVAAALTALVAEVLVATVEDAAHALGMTELFIGVVVVAVVGNAAEHFSAVIFAMRNKMDLAVTIAVGSSTQIALLIAPLLVLVSFVLGTPMALTFNAFELIALAFGTLIVNVIALDGESNWFEGLQLLAVYLVLAIAFYVVPGG
ncbi:MAG TPA: calcium/proton exchanger [Chloroflexota bacterium]